VLGHISADDVKNAIIGPHGNEEANIESVMAMVPHAQNGVKAPKATLEKIETLDLLEKKRLSLLKSTYVFMATATIIPKQR
jgi:hypothetical protein